MARARGTGYGKPAVPALQVAKPFCTTGPRLRPQLDASVTEHPLRASAILATRSKWLNNTVLHYCFFGGSSHYAVPKPQADAVRQAFATWKGVGIGLEFEEVKQLSEAEIRVGYSTADGTSASAVGRAPARRAATPSGGG